MELNQSIQKIPLKNIYESGMNPRGIITPDSVEELAKDISVHGLIYPLLVRLNKAKKKYELVAGHRRYKAIIQLNWKDVDCIIRTLTDEEAFELAVIENLQREDVHPLNEAMAFKTLMGKMTIESLAKKISKSESYIARRLKLNDLTKEAKEDFYEGDLELAHCVELCRLTEDQQKKCLIKNVRGIWDGNKKITHYEPPTVFRAFISREIMKSLNKVPFDKADKTLLPKAGACVSCPKRTGANANLFNDIQKEDNCLDGACYKLKLTYYVKRQIQQLLDDGYSKIILLTNGYCTPEEVKLYTFANQDLKQMSSYNLKFYKKEQAGTVKGVWIEGEKLGTVENVWNPDNKQSSSSSNKSETEIPAEEQIAAIEERLKRAIELDRAKVYAKIYPLLESNPLYDIKKVVNQIPLTELEEELFIYSVYKKAGYGLRGFMEHVLCGKEIDEEDESDNKIRKVIRAITPEQILQLKRVFIRSTLVYSNAQQLEKDVYTFESLTELSDHYAPEETGIIYTDQNMVRDKRERNAEEKLKVLREQLKAVKPTVSEKKKTK